MAIASSCAVSEACDQHCRVALPPGEDLGDAPWRGTQQLPATVIRVGLTAQVAGPLQPGDDAGEGRLNTPTHDCRED